MQSRVKKDNTGVEQLNVLVVEDNAFQRVAIIDLLCLCGYQVVACETGILARDELLKEESDFDLILLDMIMPEMTGLELLKIIKSIERLNDIPVIMMSAEGEQQVVAACIAAGATDYVVKPIHLKILRGLQNYAKKKTKPKSQNSNEKAYYTIIRNLGRGSFGSVELVRKSTDQELYAMKVIPTYLMDEQQKRDAENEVFLLKVLTAPTIIKYYESFTENDSMNIVMEYAECGTLDDKILEYKRSGQKFQKDKILIWAAELVIALHYMHSKNILHRDIKTQNLFLTKEEIIKVGDFGISKSLGTHGNFAETFKGTPYYMPPEVTRNEPYGKKADVWSLGCVIYELTMLKRPFQHDILAVVFDMIQNKPYEMDPSIDKDLQLIIEKTLHKDPNNRVSIQDLGNLPCIEEKIIEFYKLHPNETNYISNEKLKLGSNALTDEAQIKEENLIKIMIDLIENVQLRKITFGRIRQHDCYGVLGSDIQAHLSQNLYQKPPEEIGHLIQEMLNQDLIIPFSKQNEFNPQHYFTFPLFTNKLPANQLQKYNETSFDMLTTLSQLLNKFKEFQSKIIQNKELLQEKLSNNFSEFIELSIETQQLQKVTEIDYSQQMKLSANFNLYQLMRFHQIIQEYFVNYFIQKGIIIESKSLIQNIIGYVKPSKILDEEFHYIINKASTTLNQIKHRFLRNNKQTLNQQQILKQDQKNTQLTTKGIIVLFIEEYEQPNQVAIWPLTFIVPNIIEEYICQQIRQFIQKYVCLDVIEQEIVMHPLFQIYLSDFGTQKQLFEWTLDNIGKNYDKKKLLELYDQEEFYIRFKDPTTQ